MLDQPVPHPTSNSRGSVSDCSRACSSGAAGSHVLASSFANIERLMAPMLRRTSAPWSP